MSKKRSATAIRPDSKRFRIYNEACCVYLYDESQSDRLLQWMTTDGNNADTFFSNLLIPAFAAKVQEQNLALAYELLQDDELFVEVIVGQPLTEEELSLARWLPLQRANLSLPNGRLRIDSANTMPIAPELPADPGAIAEVPVGEYVLSLYRIDWEACRRDRIRYRGPSEIVVLTAAEQSSPVTNSSPILPYPHPLESNDWIGAYSLAPPNFQAQVYFRDAWESLRINLEPNAIEQLGATFGSILRVTVGRLMVDLIYLDQVPAEEHIARWSTAALNAAIANRPEVALASWHDYRGKTILYARRYKATKPAPSKHEEVWTPAVGTLLTETLPAAAEATP